MDIVFDTKGALSVARPRQSVINFKTGGFENVALDFNLFCCDGKFEDVKKLKKVILLKNMLLKCRIMPVNYINILGIILILLKKMG